MTVLTGTMASDVSCHAPSYLDIKKRDDMKIQMEWLSINQYAKG